MAIAWPRRWVAEQLLPRAADFIAEGELRQLEAMKALGRVGVPMEHLFFLGYPDRGLKAIAVEHPLSAKPYMSPFTKASASPYQLAFRPRAPYTGADMARDIEAVIRQVQPTVVLTHHEADRHGDHQALNALVRQVIRTMQQTEVQPRIRLYTFLVHAWDFPRPFRYAPDAPLLPPKSLWQAHRWVRFSLSPDELSHEAGSDPRLQESARQPLPPAAADELPAPERTVRGHRPLAL